MKTHGRVGRCGVGISMLATGWAAFMVLALPLSTTETAQGDIVTLRVSGTITEVARTDPDRFDLDGSVSVGSPYQLTFVIDTDAVDSNPNPAIGEFLLVASSGQVGNYTWSRAQPPVDGLDIVNDLGGFGDVYSLDMRRFEFDENFLIDGTPTHLSADAFGFVAAGISLRNLGMTALNSDSLVIPALNDWEISGFGLGFLLDENAVGFDEAVAVNGTVDSITIPEPGAAALAGLGLVSYTLRRRRSNYSCSREIRSNV